MPRTAIAQIAKLIGRELESGTRPSEDALAIGPMLAEAGATTEIVERLVAEAHRKPHTRRECRDSRPTEAVSGERQTLRWRELDSNTRSPVTWQGPQFHADYPPIGTARQKRLKRMLDWFERYGVAPSAGLAYLS